MRKPNVFNVPVRVKITPGTPQDLQNGAKYHAQAKVKVTPYGSFEAHSCGTTPHSARKFAQAFVLQAVADAILLQAEHQDRFRPSDAGVAGI